MYQHRFADGVHFLLQLREQVLLITSVARAMKVQWKFGCSKVFANWKRACR